MTQASTAELDTARTRGRKTGLDPNQQGASCPYGHSTIKLREAWSTGFGEGRSVLEAQRQVGERAMGVPVDS